MGICSSNNKINAYEMGVEAYYATERLSKSEKPMPTSSKEGKEREEKLNKLYKQLGVDVEAYILNSENIISYDDIIKMLIESEYINNLINDNDITYTTVNKVWCSFDVPDDGQWKITIDKKTGLIRIAHCKNILGCHIALTFGPMRSQVNSKEYAEMFQNNMKKVMSDLPKRINNSLVTKFRMTEYKDSNYNDFQEWYQYSTVLINQNSNTFNITNKQLEIHGMRHNDQQYYGYNMTIVCGCESIFNVMEPLLRNIIQSIKFASFEDCENYYGKLWDKMGRIKT